jgi:hypothetical protein
MRSDPRRRWTRILGTSLTAFAAAALVLLSGAPGASAACTPKLKFTITNGHFSSYDYRICQVGDADQVRKAIGTHPGLIADGVMYCVPTSAIDLMIHIAKIGYASKPAPKDFTKPANYDELTADIREMANDMGTTGHDPTLPDPALAGIHTWLAVHGTPHAGASIGGLTVEHLYQSGTSVEFPVDPAKMAVTGIGGGLVMVGVGFFDRTTGEHNGGHFVALAEAKGVPGAASSTIGVRDPYTPHTHDAVESPPVTDPWTLTPVVPGSYHVSSPYYDTTPMEARFGGYLTIEPKTALVVSGSVLGSLVPLNLANGKLKQLKHIRAGGRILDAALSPLAGEVPVLTRGSTAVRLVNRITGTSAVLGKGPAGAAHLAVGGPALSVYVAGTKRLVALTHDGRPLAGQPLAKPVDALAFDEHAGHLVALSLADRSVRFYGSDLQPAGGLRLPASFTKGRGAVDLALAPNGDLVLHRAGARAVYAIDAAQQAKAAAFPAAALSARPLRGVTAPQGLAIDDGGHLFTSDNGSLVELDANGAPVADSPYAGMRAGTIVRIDHDYSNAARDQPLDYMPPEMDTPPVQAP